MLQYIIPKIVPFPYHHPAKKPVRVIEVHLLNVGDQFAMGAKDLGSGAMENPEKCSLQLGRSVSNFIYIIVLTF